MFSGFFLETEMPIVPPQLQAYFYYMQTFLPHTDFKTSAQFLDNKRLGKQRVEAKQILNILLNRTDKKGWRNHPAVLMWRGFEDALKLYYNHCVLEWISRGFKNTMPLEIISDDINYPIWYTDTFCSFHRATLLYKNFDWYKRFNWVEKPKYEYFWPSRSI